MLHEDTRSSCAHKFHLRFCFISGQRDNMTSGKQDRSIPRKNAKKRCAHIWPDGFGFVFNVRLMIEMQIYGTTSVQY